MDINDISEYFMLHIISQREEKKFCEENSIYNISVVKNLLKIHYFIITKKSCWTKDVACSVKEGKEQRVEIGMHYLFRDRYINEIERDKVLGKSWELTNKAIFLLDRYAAWLREEQKNLDYKIKLSHKESRELREK